jgi:exo-beta-1,3-glucanase (GH17 family)
MKKSLLFTVAVLLLLTAGLNAQNVPVAGKRSGIETHAPYQLDGLNFSPYKDGQNPELECCRQINEDQLRERMMIVSPYTKWIRTFSCRFGLEKTGRIAHEIGHKAAIGAWLGPESTNAGRLANEAEIDSLIKRANAGEVDLAIVGSEVMLRHDRKDPGEISEAQLIAYINRVRQSIPAHIPVTTADVYGALLAHPAVIDTVDLVFVNYYPYWEGVEVNKAIARLHCWHQRMLAAAKGKQVVVSETGWPSCGNTLGCAVPSPENASFYFLNFISWARANQVSYFYFSAFDESWKAKKEGPQGACWGIWDKGGNLKPGMQRVFDGETIPKNWSTGEIPGGSGTPAIELTCVPPYGSKEFLQGQVWHVRPDDFKVAIYIYIGQLNGWWNKPTYDERLTAINCDGSWAANIVTGGIDERATMLIAFLVPKEYFPPMANRAPELPAALDSAAIAWVARTRVPSSGAWGLMKKGGILEVASSNGTEFPQYAALHAKDSYFRMNYGPGSDWGTSAILLPSFWEGGKLHQGAPITTICKHDGADLLLSIAGNISSLRVRGQVRLSPPPQNMLSGRITMNASGNLNLDHRPGEAFKPVMLSSMHVSGEQWDASSAYVDARTFQIPDSGWIIQPPITGSVFGLKGGTSQWKINAPTIEVKLDESRPITGWVTPSQNPNDDNVGLWAASDSVMHSWQYTLVAKKPVITSVQDVSTEIPASFELEQNFPNPFNPSTTIRFAVSKPTHVTIKIYDAQGREVRTLVDRPFAAGKFVEIWDGRNDGEVSVMSGVYFVRMQTAEFVQVRKLVLVR